MYSDYGALGIDCRMLIDPHQYQRMRQTATTTSDWLGFLPVSRSQSVGDWRASVRELQKWWRPTPVAVETAAQCQPLNLNVVGGDTSPCCGPRRLQRDPNLDDDGRGSTERTPAERCGPPNKRRRFDFTRLAESATSRDDSSTDADAAFDAEIQPASNGDGMGLKVAKYDDDQSDRRLSLKPAAAAAANHADRRSPPLWSFPHHSAVQQLRPVFNPIESYVGYISSVLFDDNKH